MTKPNFTRRSPRSLLRLSLIASVLVLAPSCGSSGVHSTPTPPAADLTQEAEPQLDARALTENRADLLDDYDIAHRAWGQRGWAAVSRLCWWFKDRKLVTPECGARP